MKLWQRVVILTLLFSVASVEISSVTVLKGSFSVTVESEREKCAAAHNNLCTTASANAAYERMKSGRLRLTDDEINSSIYEVLDSFDGCTTLYCGEEQLYLKNGPIPEALDSEFITDTIGGGQCITRIYREGEKYLTAAGSTLKIEGKEYRLLSFHDVSASFKACAEQLSFIRGFNIVFSAVLTLFMILIFSGLLRPLGDVNRALGELTGGNYNIRLRQKGAREFRELEKNINIMAKSVKENTEKIEQVAESRKQFINNLAHEMKTPLTSIMGFSDILRVKKSVSDKERREYAQIIVEETKRLRSLSGKLLELATAGGAALETERVSAKQLFEEVFITFLPRIRETAANVSFSGKDEMLTVDRELFKSLLYNLIDNAIKATGEKGEIHISCGGDRQNIYITVTDNGIGMSEKEMKRITEPFYMVDKARSRKKNGAGLGLPLCVEIAKRHGGSLDIKSEKGRGTAVTITLPRKMKNENV